MKMKPFYSDYVRHCLRFYARYHDPIPVFRSNIDLENWEACETVLDKHLDYKQLVFDIFCEKGSVMNAVTKIATELNCTESSIWNILFDIEKDIAIERGLI